MKVHSRQFIEMKKHITLIAITVSFLIFTKVNFAQAPDLGTASAFSVFTAVGAFNNLGSSNLTGSIGTDAGAFTGFPPGSVNGAIHVADLVSAQVATDVDVAYGYLSTVGCGLVIGTSIGNGQVLTPNVYCTGAASTLNGDLTLDAQGDSAALFIFKIDGAFSTSTFARVVLINSASSCNVYWQINGQFTLGDSAVFMGTALVNGAVILLEASSVEGGVLSRSGAVSLNNNLVTRCVQQNNLLPVSLVSFIAEKCVANTCVNLDWQTATEMNSDYFLIESSTDGVNFTDIGRHKAAGYSTQLLAYSFTDENPVEGVNYYRLNQYDFDGMHEYSGIIAVRLFLTISEVSIYPNPFSSLIEIFIADTSPTNSYKLRIVNVSGMEVINTAIAKHLTTLETGNLPSGIYLYTVISNNSTIQSGRLISQQ